MRLYYDFHIHSALSPCADDDMTPNNIVNMSRLKGLDAIAVCDHNCAENLQAVSELALKADILFIPGIEINTSEEVHILAYFKELKKAVLFGEMVYDALPEIKNNESFFGRQLVMDNQDAVVGTKKKLLISALPFSFEESLRLIAEYGGYAVPAHINRGANSVLGNLGFIPPSSGFRVIETMPGREEGGEDFSKYRILHSSDAHILENISEREHSFSIEKKTLFSIFTTLFEQK